MLEAQRREGRRPPAIILGGSVNAVSVARGLGPVGVETTALGTGARDPVRHSRHCHRYVAFERDEHVQQRWFAWLEDNAAQMAGSVLLPCNDDALELIARRRADLAMLDYRAFEADDAVLLAMLDKQQTYELARRAGVQVPTTRVLREPTDLAAAADEIGFPCGLKPLHSHLLARHRKWGKIIVAADRGELETIFAELHVLGIELLATEVIPGDDDRYRSYYSYLDAAGQPLLRFTKRKLRGYPPRAGLTSYHLTSHDDEVAELGLRFFQGVGVRGLANVEFKHDPRDGALKLIECNHRFTAANELVRLAGINLALLTYERALGLPGPEFTGYRVGMRLWDPLDDLRAFWALRAEGKLTGPAWARSLLHRQHLPLLRWTDPGPGLHDLVDRPRSVLAKRRERRLTALRSPAATLTEHRRQR